MKKRITTPITESASNYDRLEEMELKEILVGINKEDQTVAKGIQQALPAIERMTTTVITKLKQGGRLFYIGSGTSGRLGVLDASEIPPTYGVFDKVIGIIAGGERALRKAVEHAEDDMAQAWRDMVDHGITSQDMVIGISASGSTPYVVGGLMDAHRHGITTGCIVSNQHNTRVARHANFPVELVTGPEFVTGSTRMKAGTAQKLILNMISTSTMIALGHVRGNKMIGVQPSNNKLIRRSILLLMEELDIDEAKSKALLAQHGSVRKAMDACKA